MLNKRLIVIILTVIFLANGPFAAKESIGEAKASQTENIAVQTMDERAKILQSYLEEYKSPLSGHAQDFIDAADKYNLDWKFVAAISGVESTFGKFVPGGSGTPYSSYNAWGWGVYGDQVRGFRSWKDGIYTVSEGLRKNYFNKGLQDPYSINRVYAASPTWGAKVTHFLSDIEKFEEQYQKTQDKRQSADLKPQVAGESAVAVKIKF